MNNTLTITLSSRQREALEAFGAGLCAQAVANKMGITLFTANGLRQKLNRKARALACGTLNQLSSPCLLVFLALKLGVIKNPLENLSVEAVPFQYRYFPPPHRSAKQTNGVSQFQLK